MKIDYVQVLTDAIAAAAAAPVAENLASRRVYILPDTEHNRGLKVAAFKLGMIYGRSVFGCNALYVGYDNATGLEIGKADAMVSALRAAGVGCYRSTWDD